MRPFPQFSRILDHAPIGHAKYKALYVRAEKRFAKRYQFLVSYSLASNKDDSPEAQVTSPANYGLDWGPAGADRRHNLVASGSALLPAKFTFGAVWTVRSSLPFSALSNTLDVDGIRQYVPGTSRDMGNRNLDLSVVNTYRASLGLPPIAAGTIDSSRYNSFDVLLSRPVYVKEHRRLELALHQKGAPRWYGLRHHHRRGERDGRQLDVVGFGVPARCGHLRNQHAGLPSRPLRA